MRLWHSELAFSWDADYFSDDVRLDAVRSLFASVCESFRAFFGFVVADDAFTQFWKVFGGRQVAHANLGDVSWLNYYGPVTVARLGGIERFSALGVTRHVDAHGGIMIEAAPTPWYVRPDATGIEDYEFKQPFYETIGASAFAHGDGWEPHAEPPLPSAEDQYRGVPQTPDEDLG